MRRGGLLITSALAHGQEKDQIGETDHDDEQNVGKVHERLRT